MADFLSLFGSGLTNQAEPNSRFTLLNLSSDVLTARPLPPQIITLNQFPFDIFGTYQATNEALFSETVTNYLGFVDPGPHAFWFEIVHITPQTIVLGNILATIIREIEIYNAFRESTRTLTSAVANAGPGVTFVDLPTLPFIIQRQNGLLFDVRVSTDGPAEINGTLDFVVSAVSLVITITGTRVIMFPFEPETPVHEVLQFKTDILKATNGTEQRVSIRKHPRQIFDMRFGVLDEKERRLLENQIFSWHPRIFGLPVWFEAKVLGANININDTVITVNTAYADFRVGSLAIVWRDAEYFDALQIASFTATTVTFTSPITKAYSQALVMPLRFAFVERTINVQRYLQNLEFVQMRFNVTDNEADIGSTTGWPIHNTKIMLDDSNLVPGDTIIDNVVQDVDLIDNLTASPIQFSDWTVGEYVTTKGFFARGAQRIWEVRQLMHALRGSQLSFYMPTFFHDMVVVNNLGSGTALMDIENMNYVDFINAQEPNASVWIKLNNGTILTRKVLSAIEQSSTIERLTVDVVWPSTILVTDINRVSFLRLSRIADDQIAFEHTSSQEAKISMSVVGVKQ